MHFKLASGAVLLRLGARGFLPFAADVPTIWVTAPTEGTKGLGFAINAPFDLDVGRAQLARNSTHNYDLAGQLSSEFGAALRSLARMTSEAMEELARQSGFAADVTAYDLWDSLWALFARRLPVLEGEEVLQVVKRVLWGHNEGGMAEVVAHHDVIPTGLSGAYRVLTRLDCISRYTAGAIDIYPDIFEQISSWHSFQQTVVAGTVVSGEIMMHLRHSVRSQSRRNRSGCQSSLERRWAAEPR